MRTELRGHFRPEFLNRVDDIIIFHSLDEAQLATIVDIQLQRLEKRLAQQHLTLEVDKAAKRLLAKEGYDPQFGARPLKRAIQEQLLDPLAMNARRRVQARRPHQCESGRWRVDVCEEVRATNFIARCTSGFFMNVRQTKPERRFSAITIEMPTSMPITSGPYHSVCGLNASMKP